MKTRSNRLFLKSVFAAALFFGATAAVFAFTEPTVAPPGGNVAAPINTGPTAQTKTGNILLFDTWGGGNTLNLNENQIWNSNDTLYLQWSGPANSDVVVGSLPGGSGAAQSLVIGKGDLTIGETGTTYQICLNGICSSTVGSSTSNWTLTGNNLSPTVIGNNVGIGIAAPLNKLAVQTNDNTFAKAVLINNTNTGADAQAAIQLTQGTNTSYLFQGGVTTYLWNAANGPLAFFTNSAERMRIDSTGNVGIGNTAPAYKLDVAGNVNVASGYCFSVAGTCITSGTNYFSLGTTWAANDTLYNNTGGTIRAQNQTALSGFAQMSAGDTTHAGYFSWYKAPGGTGATNRLGYMGYDNNDINLTLENSADFVITNGNVGIGTAAPTQKLDVNGDIAMEGTSVVFGNADDVYMNARVIRNTSATNQDGMFINYGGTGANNSIKFYTPGTTERMRIDSTGNVGIGNTAPTYKLDVAGNVNVASGYCFSVAGTCITSGGNQWTTSGTNIYNSNTGNVGIGNTAPVYKLDVTGDVIANWHRSRGATGWYNETYSGGWYMSDALWVRSYANKGVWAGTGNIGTDGGITVGYGGSYVAAGGAIFSGNVGIGTASPGFKLDVAGVIAGQSVAGTGDVLRIGDDSKLADVDVANTAGLYGLQNATIASLQLGSSGGTVSGYNGNIGIGNTAPAYKLDVGGDANATRLCIAGVCKSSWTSAALTTNYNCLPGQYMIGISNGDPVCQSLPKVGQYAGNGASVYGDDLGTCASGYHYGGKVWSILQGGNITAKTALPFCVPDN